MTVLEDEAFARMLLHRAATDPSSEAVQQAWARLHEEYGRFAAKIVADGLKGMGEIEMRAELAEAERDKLIGQRAELMAHAEQLSRQLNTLRKRKKSKGAKR